MVFMLKKANDQPGGRTSSKSNIFTILPHDAYGRDWGLLIGEKLPATIGTNASGIIEEVGSNVTEFSKGDEVFGRVNELSKENDQAGLQEYATLTATAITKKPAGLSLDEVVALPVYLVTSFVALFTTKLQISSPVGHGEGRVRCLKADSRVHRWRLQESVITIAGLDDKEELERMGANHVIDRQCSNDEIAKQVHAITGREGVTHLYDCRSLSFELAASLLPAHASSRPIALHPIEQAQAELLVERSPNCSATLVENIHLGDDGRLEDVLVARSQVAGRREGVAEQISLDQVGEINAALNAYMLVTDGPQLIVGLE
ncbi:hypothetical protein AC578_1373 [Pseudocercospora eumusae]|uniref:Alcohol dehydrogenase-like N-terminal domain-containing protein n=1 Tax=Pseudocercospora eumusae TaxID=321146 RepID=A0A139HUN7_9PEZI|nr:hypothetical protein AC578_1373 [Pseudocercospora eumusae]